MRNTVENNKFSILIPAIFCLIFMGSGLVQTAEAVSTIEKQDVLSEVVVAKESIAETILVREGFRYKILPPEDTALLRNLSELSPEQQLSFIKNRTFVLEKMLSLLSWRHLRNGRGAILGKKIVQDQNISANETFSKMDGSSALQNDVKAAYSHEFSERVRAAGGEKALFRQEAYSFVIAQLRALDERLFQYAGLVSQPTEWGFTMTAGATVGAGAGQKTWGHTGLLNLNLGIDFKTKSLVFEVSYIHEKYSKNLTPLVASGGVLASGGLYVKNGQFNGSHRGQTVTPPSLTPVGFIASGYSNYAEMGGMVGASPLVIDFLAGFISDSKKNRVIKIEISPFRLGFLRVQVGENIKEQLLSVKTLTQRWFSPAGGPSCRRIHRAG